LALMVALSTGCGDSAPQPKTGAAHIELPLPPDPQVLKALDYFEPMYKIDDAGRVVRLRVVWRHLTPATLAEIGKLTELIHIDAYGSSVNDEGLAQLKDLRKLRSFGLGATDVTDKGLVHLQKLETLQWLWLPKNGVTPEGRDKLKEARPDMNIYLQ
jgi:hypothetical protein